MNKILLAIPALLTLASVHAADPRIQNVRPIITLNAAKDENTLTPDAASDTMQVENLTFGPEDQRPFIIRAKGLKTTSTAGWKEYSLTFTPANSGYVWLSLEGEYPPKEDPDLVLKVDFDDVSVEGAKIVNGDFEEKSADAGPKAWKYSAEAIPNDSFAGESDSSYVTVTANNRIGQTITVRAGEPVTVTFKARAHTPPIE